MNLVAKNSKGHSNSNLLSPLLRSHQRTNLFQPFNVITCIFIDQKLKKNLSLAYFINSMTSY